MSDSTTVATNASLVPGCVERVPAAAHGASAGNVTLRGDDEWEVTYSCDEGYAWDGGSQLRTCSGADGNWTGTQIVCSYYDPILRAELVGGIVGGVFFILLIVLSIDFIHQKRKKLKGRRHSSRRNSKYDVHPRPTSFIISYVPTDFDSKTRLSEQRHQSPDVIKDAKKTKSKGKTLKKKGSVASELGARPKQLEPINKAVKGKKKKKKKVQPVYTIEDNLLSSTKEQSVYEDPDSNDRPLPKLKKLKKKKKKAVPLETYTVPDPYSEEPRLPAHPPLPPRPPRSLANAPRESEMNQYLAQFQDLSQNQRDYRVPEQMQRAHTAPSIVLPSPPPPSAPAQDDAYFQNEYGISQHQGYGTPAGERLGLHLEQDSDAGMEVAVPVTPRPAPRKVPPRPLQAQMPDIEQGWVHGEQDPDNQGVLY